MTCSPRALAARLAVTVALLVGAAALWHGVDALGHSFESVPVTAAVNR